MHDSYQEVKRIYNFKYNNILKYIIVLLFTCITIYEFRSSYKSLYSKQLSSMESKHLVDKIIYDNRIDAIPFYGASSQIYALNYANEYTNFYFSDILTNIYSNKYCYNVFTGTFINFFGYTKNNFEINLITNKPYILFGCQNLLVNFNKYYLSNGKSIILLNRDGLLDVFLIR